MYLAAANQAPSRQVPNEPVQWEKAEGKHSSPLIPSLPLCTLSTVLTLDSSACSLGWISQEVPPPWPSCVRRIWDSCGAVQPLALKVIWCLHNVTVSYLVISPLHSLEGLMVYTIHSPIKMSFLCKLREKAKLLGVKPGVPYSLAPHPIARSCNNLREINSPLTCLLCPLKTKCATSAFYRTQSGDQHCLTVCEGTWTPVVDLS